MIDNKQPLLISAQPPVSVTTKDKSEVSFCDFLISTAFFVKFTLIISLIAYAWIWSSH